MGEGVPVVLAAVTLDLLSVALISTGLAELHCGSAFSSSLHYLLACEVKLEQQKC